MVKFSKVLFLGIRLNFKMIGLISRTNKLLDFNRGLFKNYYAWNARCVSYLHSRNEVVYEKLHKRGLLQVQGIDSFKFLQGLVTNDMRHFENNGTGTKAPSLYAMILSVQGDVLYDVILYNLKNGQSQPNTNFLLECDRAGVDELTKLFTMYRIRKKVEMNDITDEYTPWVIYSLYRNNEKASEVSDIIKLPIKDPAKIHFLTKDPRINILGWRLILPADVEPSTVIEAKPASDANEINYHKLRYQLGVGEGIDDIPPGKCYPLECNADYMHGVSFHKGCYLGQELTARTHHTGVVRKRLMPLLFTSSEDHEIARETIIENEKGRNVGKFIGKTGKYGLGLMRIQESLASKQLKIKGKGLTVTTRKPLWWPEEKSSKETLAM